MFGKLVREVGAPAPAGATAFAEKNQRSLAILYCIEFAGNMQPDGGVQKGRNSRRADTFQLISSRQFP
jgi:hypothetical protein